MSEDADELVTGLEKYVLEAEKLRARIARGDIGDSADQIHAQLIQARASLDRVEAIVVHLMRLRGRQRSNVARAQRILENARNEAYNETKFDSWVTGAERAAWIAPMVEEQQQALDVEDRLLDQIEVAHEVCSMIRWGIDGVRRDCDTRLRMISVARSLEQ